MSREKTGFRDTLAALNEMFPDQVALNRTQVAQALGVNRTTDKSASEVRKMKYAVPAILFLLNDELFSVIALTIMVLMFLADCWNAKDKYKEDA